MLTCLTSSLSLLLPWEDSVSYSGELRSKVVLNPETQAVSIDSVFSTLVDLTESLLKCRHTRNWKTYLRDVCMER